MQADLPLLEYWSAPHNPAQAVTPAVAEYVPVSQSRHHSAIAQVSGPYFPGSQSVHVVEPEPEYVPNPQSIHCLKSTTTATVEYLPEEQGWHVGPPYCPTSQILHSTNPVPHKKNEVEMKLRTVRCIVCGHNAHEYWELGVT